MGRNLVIFILVCFVVCNNAQARSCQRIGVKLGRYRMPGGLSKYHLRLNVFLLVERRGTQNMVAVICKGNYASTGCNSDSACLKLANGEIIWLVRPQVTQRYGLLGHNAYKAKYYLSDEQEARIRNNAIVATSIYLPECIHLPVFERHLTPAIIKKINKLFL